MKALKKVKKSLHAILPPNNLKATARVVPGPELTVSMLHAAVQDDVHDTKMLSRCGRDQSQAPIHVLPAEVLADIFMEVCVKAVQPLEYSFFECSEVCVHWRQIALGMPLLWSKVNFCSPTWVQTCLRRSKSSPLIVECHLSHFIISRRQMTIHQRIAAVLEFAPERIREVFLYGHFPHESLTRALRGRFPVLAKMSITQIINETYSTPTGSEREPLYPSL
ncbi:F-box domain-containing protein [Mycena indigotica]|uniref:F-box domain-containing protein n=1 Tax=Mycena indigotica TaxID=2126181 RepID=A0A8H6SGL2_9AGAR|nr:F-box domain-containing protein [Mycena indigotica]KAF7298522.1 F-box domain-containing protein [Mycena indigotica]